MMEQLTRKDGSSMDMVKENIDKLKEIFPDVFTEGKVDFDALQAVLGDYVETGEERYSFNWHGKAQARRIAQTPSTGTLRPCPEESVDWDNTQNLFIEGDNLEVLKLLQKSYHKKVKMIYIDPPYNTGKEFIYPDKFQENLDTYLKYTGQKDDEGHKFSTNTETTGRYHTNWLNMMYPRLRLARNLLRDDGVIFISIDDNEVDNLRKMCNEIFGEENFLTQFSWKTDGNFDNQAKFKKCHEYILVYAKVIEMFPHPPVIDPNVPKDSKLYRSEIRNTIVKNGPKNPVGSVTLPVGFPVDFESGEISARDDAWPHYESNAIVKNWKLVNSVVVTSGWSSKELLEQFIANMCNPVLDIKEQETVFKIARSGAIEVIKKRMAEQSHVITTLSNFGGPQKASAELESIGVVFDDYPKPRELISYFIQMNQGNEFIVLDFFAGSCTTAHAVLELNRNDGGNRKFIMVQLPEPCSENSEAFKMELKTIADIGKERIRRAAAKIKEENPDYDGDLGFKVLKLDSSNIKPWDADFDNIQQSLEDSISNIKSERSEEDVLYEILLKYGLDLTLPIETRMIEGKKVFSIGLGALVICLDSNITLDVVEGIGKLKTELEPEVMRVVFKDNGFKDDVVKTNAIQILKRYDIEDVKSL